MAYVESNRAAPARHNPQLHEIVIGELKSKQPGSFLDIPSGPGYLVRDLQAVGFKGIAGEIDESLHCFADLKYAKTDMTARLEFPDNHFDYVTSIEGIEHIDNHYAFLKEVSRVLKPGGSLYLTTPNVHSLASRWNFFLSGFHLLAPKPIPTDTENIYFEHINPITLNQLHFYCERVGMRIEKLTTHRKKRKSILLYALFYPLIRWSVWRACFKKETSEQRRKLNESLYKFLSSSENQLGSHTIIVARKLGK